MLIASFETAELVSIVLLDVMATRGLIDALQHALVMAEGLAAEKSAKSAALLGSIFGTEATG